MNFVFEKAGHLIASNGAYNSCFHLYLVVTLHQMKSKENWVENVKSQVCVYQTERAVQERKVNKKWFQQKDQKNKQYDLFFYLL